MGTTVKEGVERKCGGGGAGDESRDEGGGREKKGNLSGALLSSVKYFLCPTTDPPHLKHTVFHSYLLQPHEQISKMRSYASTLISNVS